MQARNRPIAYADHIAIAKLIETAVRQLRGKTDTPPTLVGICGAQGSGKSTLTETIANQLRGKGLRIATLSLDDLYLRRAEREHLAKTVHPLFITRGVPGTHDTAIGEQILDALGRTGTVRLPRFDKSIDDRLPERDWDEIEAPVDVILFEGWCIGAQSQSEKDLADPVNALERIEDTDGIWRGYANAALADDYRRLFGRIDLLVLLKAPSFEIVAQWRNEQEENLRKKLCAEGRTLGSGLMDAQEIGRFVQHYERTTRHILSEMPARANLLIMLDEHRQIVDLGMTND